MDDGRVSRSGDGGSGDLSPHAPRHGQPSVEESVDLPLHTPRQRRSRRQAEFLVHQRVSTQVIRWNGIYDDRRGEQVGGILRDHPLAERIIVRPAWYYGYGRGWGE
ncbi:DarT ssDNA thymidine ADP-ribosyltransferase family protein [Plantactinospora sp. WMMB782]|uniref:DarT ssDNA thymidine ADP-ribosyltransferase family protein n=1 Tax=Plantactinospora sp. WMMB782 TaxID=3404121 RepID=UPI003B936235